MARLIEYRRVSSEEQKTGGYGLNRQHEDAKNFCKTNKHKIVYSLDDDYTGASYLRDRPEGRKVYELLESGKAEGVLFPSISRFARLLKILVNMASELLEAGYQVYSVDMGRIESIDPNFLIRAWDAERQYRDLIEYTTRGRLDKARAGKAVGTGGQKGVSWGYIAQGQGKDHKRVINKGIAGTIKHIYEWYDRGMGAIKIADKLDSLGIESPVSKIKRKGRIIDTAQWTKSKVIHILSNRAYVGVVEYAGVEYIDKSLQIISDDLWTRVEARRKNGAIHPVKNHDYILSQGRLVCACGGSMAGFSTHGYLYYKCWRKTEYAASDPRRCQYPVLRRDDIETTALAWLINLALNKNKLASLIDDLRNRSDREIEPLRKRHESLQGQLTDASLNIEKYMGLIDRTSDPILISGYESHLQRYADLQRGTQTLIDENQQKMEQYSLWVGDSAVTVESVSRELQGIFGFLPSQKGLELDFSRIDRTKARQVIAKYDLRVQLQADGQAKVSCVFGVRTVEVDKIDSMSIGQGVIDFRLEHQGEEITEIELEPGEMIVESISSTNIPSCWNAWTANIILSETIPIKRLQSMGAGV